MVITSTSYQKSSVVREYNCWYRGFMPGHQSDAVASNTVPKHKKTGKIYQRQCLVGFKLLVVLVSIYNSPSLTINEHFCRSIQMLHSLNWDETLCNLHLKSDLQISEGMRFVLSSTILLFYRDHNSQNNDHGVKI